MAYTKITKDMNIIAALDNEPNDVGGLTAAELKAKFDEGGLAVKESFNGLIDELDASAAGTTATKTEVDQLHEAGAVKADFEKLHGITATASQLNDVDNKYKKPDTGIPESDLSTGVRYKLSDTVSISDFTAGTAETVMRRAAYGGSFSLLVNSESQAGSIQTNAPFINLHAVYSRIGTQWSRVSDYAYFYHVYQSGSVRYAKQYVAYHAYSVATVPESYGWDKTGETVQIYEKPATGIPKADLESSVQTSLELADTALQSHQDITGKQDKITASGLLKGAGSGSVSAAGAADVPGFAYTTTAPTEANTDGIKVCVLSAEPPAMYDGWLYLIKE